MGVQHPDQVRLQLCGQVVDLLYRDAPQEHAGEGLPGCDQSAVKPLYPHYLTIPPTGQTPAGHPLHLHHEDAGQDGGEGEVHGRYFLCPCHVCKVLLWW